MNSKEGQQYDNLNAEDQKRKHATNQNDQLSPSLDPEQSSIQNDQKVQNVKNYTKENRSFFQSLWKRKK